MRLKTSQLMPYKKTIAVLKPIQNTVWAENRICRSNRKIAENDYGFRHVRPSFRMEQLCLHWMEFVKFYF
jgi:hypothetical protein